MSAPCFSDSLECVHCGCDVDIPLREGGEDGRLDHWLRDGEVLRCASCGGENAAIVDGDGDGGAYFAECDGVDCGACDAG